MEFAHFYAGMSLYKRAQAMLAVDDWVRAAAEGGGRFFVALSSEGVLRVVAQNGMTLAAYQRHERLACIGGDLIGVYVNTGDLTSVLWLSDVLDDIRDALKRFD